LKLKDCLSYPKPKIIDGKGMMDTYIIELRETVSLLQFNFTYTSVGVMDTSIPTTIYGG
jgi:hypothetical protein